MSPYVTKNSISEKCASGNFFHSQNMFHNTSYWLKPKSHQQFFRQLFSLTKHVSQHFILIKAKKSSKNF